MPYPSQTWKCFKGQDADNVAWAYHHSFTGDIVEVYNDCAEKSAVDFPEGDYIYQPKTYWDIGLLAGGDVIPVETFAGTMHQVTDRQNVLHEDPGGSYTATGNTDVAPI